MHGVYKTPLPCLTKRKVLPKRSSFDTEMRHTHTKTRCSNRNSPIDTRIYEIATTYLPIQEATALSDSEKKLLLAESRFLRAMHYFTLVKRYGGVPLIDEPQQYDPNNLEALMVPRNKEVEIYDFIVKRMPRSRTRSSRNKRGRSQIQSK